MSMASLLDDVESTRSDGQGQAMRTTRGGEVVVTNEVYGKDLHLTARLRSHRQNWAGKCKIRKRCHGNANAKYGGRRQWRMRNVSKHAERREGRRCEMCRTVHMTELFATEIAASCYPMGKYGQLSSHKGLRWCKKPKRYTDLEFSGRSKRGVGWTSSASHSRLLQSWLKCERYGGQPILSERSVCAKMCSRFSFHHHLLPSLHHPTPTRQLQDHIVKMKVTSSLASMLALSMLIAVSVESAPVSKGQLDILVRGLGDAPLIVLGNYQDGNDNQSGNGNQQTSVSNTNVNGDGNSVTSNSDGSTQSQSQNANQSSGSSTGQTSQQQSQQQSQTSNNNQVANSQGAQQQAQQQAQQAQSQSQAQNSNSGQGSSTGQTQSQSQNSVQNALQRRCKEWY
ncbi:hypothetical protein PHSY_005372 [Pseudozyma hubeiensis SY62]|uniref:Uncharacterized protein n=1 Tax=Pseudozyma hubeiensis (strain SY62) TaxID=1305764 RepID=R9PI69_PSEHS|nr:hypothetical protein PHSY_005372 [Pseudozyma hubeiensis SY62]GAC97785.1 hypothetical protein PHSY_005372 [Pseudozyma hubeiensis SY62]